ncbi:MAG: helix-turn-helix domain-containing protein [Emergencia sp.]
MTLNFVEIGKRLKEGREALHLTQEQLAEQTDLSVTHISAIENASSGVKLQTFVNIVNALDLPIDWVLYGDYDNKLFVEGQIRKLFAGCNTKEIQLYLSILKNNKDLIEPFIK